jgi:hypothetical protein
MALIAVFKCLKASHNSEVFSTVDRIDGMEIFLDCDILRCTYSDNHLRLQNYRVLMLSRYNCSAEYSDERDNLEGVLDIPSLTFKKQLTNGGDNYAKIQ